MRPGLYELVGDENGTGTALAALIARRVKGPVYWLTSTADYAPAIFNLLDWWPTGQLYQGSRVAPAFEFMRAVDRAGVADLIVLDSLAGLHGTHPQAQTIANDVKRGVAGWEPQTPVLVVNQARVPAPPGGVHWRARVNSRELIPLHSTPIISLLADYTFVNPWFLVWHPGRQPEFRPLEQVEEWTSFFPDGVPGYRIQIDEAGVHATCTHVERQHPWLI